MIVLIASLVPRSGFAVRYVAFKITIKSESEAGFNRPC